MDKSKVPLFLAHRVHIRNKYQYQLIKQLKNEVSLTG